MVAYSDENGQPMSDGEMIASVLMLCAIVTVNFGFIEVKLGPSFFWFRIMNHDRRSNREPSLATESH